MNEQQRVQQHPYLTTASGRRVVVHSMRRQDVHLGDIVYSTSMLCRFVGHISRFYSVAEHQVLVAALAEQDGHDEDVIRCCLLHDASEAYTGDVASPLKAMLPGYKDIERHVESVIARALGLPQHDHDVWKIVKHFDQVALMHEADALFPTPPDWIDYRAIEAYPRPELLWSLGRHSSQARGLLATWLHRFGMEVEPCS